MRSRVWRRNAPPGPVSSWAERSCGERQHLARTGRWRREYLDRGAAADHDDAEAGAASISPARAPPARWRELQRRRLARSGCARSSSGRGSSRPSTASCSAHHAEEGETVTSGSAGDGGGLRRTRVEAEVDEFDSPALREGAEVAAEHRRTPWESFRGRVFRRSRTTWCRGQLKPEDPGRPSNTRVPVARQDTLGR